MRHPLKDLASGEVTGMTEFKSPLGSALSLTRVYRGAVRLSLKELNVKTRASDFGFQSPLDAGREA